MKRLLWIDISKALAISFVVYFHFFRTVFEHYEPPPPDWSGIVAGTVSFLRARLVGNFRARFSRGRRVHHSQRLDADGVNQRATQTKGELSWSGWYRARFVRLYPMYWVAHIVYLVSPFVAKLEPVDSRIVLSLLGLRFINIEMNFMYLNAAWWYFAMLIQFYLIFPLLFWAARKFGAVDFSDRRLRCSDFLCVTFFSDPGRRTDCGCSADSRFAGLPEFALGMALAMWHAKLGRRARNGFLLARTRS